MWSFSLWAITSCTGSPGLAQGSRGLPTGEGAENDDVGDDGVLSLVETTTDARAVADGRLPGPERFQGQAALADEDAGVWPNEDGDRPAVGFDGRPVGFAGGDNTLDADEGRGSAMAVHARAAAGRPGAIVRGWLADDHFEPEDSRRERVVADDADAGAEWRPGAADEVLGGRAVDVDDQLVAAAGVDEDTGGAAVGSDGKDRNRPFDAF